MKKFLFAQIKAWLPASLWCAFIFLGSTDDVGGKSTSLRVMTFLHENFPTLSWEQLADAIYYLRKACHVSEYAVLTSLVFFGFLRSGLVGWKRIWSSRMAILTFLICVGYAASDEYHQSFTAERQGCWTDVLIDSFGVLLGLGGMWVLSYFRGVFHSNKVLHRVLEKSLELEEDSSSASVGVQMFSTTLKRNVNRNKRH